MLLYLAAALRIALTAAYTVPDASFPRMDNEELRWADTYSVKATRVSLTSNIVEDFSAWKTNQSSRIDYNKGAFKVITSLSTDGDGSPIQFEIHPETTDKELNAIVCHLSFASKSHTHVSLGEILPHVIGENYKAVGNETISDDILATRFENFELKVRQQKDSRKTLWAYYSGVYGWTPLKYEVKKYNSVLGSLMVHEIWDFFEYIPDYIDENVFDAEKFGCNNNTILEHSADSEKITKELLFIDPEDKEHVDHVFKHFKNKYNRKYAHEKEHELRRKIFKENMRMISRANRRNLTYKLGVNQFSDRTPEELKMNLGIIPRPEGMKATVAFPYDENNIKDELDKVPKEYDMRVDGLVSPVKDQGECGSCWTFAAAGAVESGLARVNGGKVLSLSNQAILDCAYEDLAEIEIGGCRGGFDYAAYDFIEKYGLPTDQEYGPYKMRDGYCNIGNMSKTYSIRGYTDVTKYSANAMKVAAFNNGALFIYIHLSDEFYGYSSGIFYQPESECNPERLNHAVVLVGYGERYGELYWILKNSWGENWGEDGYMLISAKDNVCGVASNPTYPVF